MDASRFDTWTRTISSRRAALAGLTGLGLALLRRTDTTAHNGVAACKKIKNAKKKRACLKRGRAHNARHRCTPQSVNDTCAGRCGVWRDNCNNPVACFTCPPGKTCLANGSCAQSCPVIFGPGCPATCLCFGPELGNGNYCGNPVNFSCATIPPVVCASTAECPINHSCTVTSCGPGSTSQNRCVPLCLI